MKIFSVNQEGERLVAELHVNDDIVLTDKQTTLALAIYATLSGLGAWPSGRLVILHRGERWSYNGLAWGGWTLEGEG